MHFLVLSPCSHDFLLTSLYIVIIIFIMVVNYYSSFMSFWFVDSELSTRFFLGCQCHNVHNENTNARKADVKNFIQ